LLETRPLFRGRPQDQPFGIKVGGPGLDARLITDLSKLDSGSLITPNELAYIRTEIPAAARAALREPWTLKADGLIEQARRLQLDDLRQDERAMGPHLFECSGNGNPSNFGLMSVAEWHGIPLTDVIARLKPSKAATAVLVSGYDHDGQVSQRSVPGASWVFPLDSLDRLGAFFGTRMNGEPLPPDHGQPVRLCVPGWYGCTWIKWVNEVRLVGPDEPATGQMVEFAGRTHQTAQHPLARDYAPADIQTAATPIRVEKRRGSSGLFYRVVGIVWGGQAPVEELEIRFGPADSWKRLAPCSTPRTHRIWSLWEYRWQPATAGLYEIALRVPDTSVPQRRLTSGYYTRHVEIREA
jgi:DMSO/TMAO reductase YedYZ molybdopterin-dependent catalytic subunit